MFEWRRRTQDLDVRNEGFKLLYLKFLSQCHDIVALDVGTLQWFASMLRHYNGFCS